MWNVGGALVTAGSGAIQSVTTGNPVPIAAAYISALDEINEGTRSVAAGFENMFYRSFKEQGAKRIDEAEGAFDGWLENDVVAGARDIAKITNLVFSVTSIRNQIFSGAESIDDVLRILTDYGHVISDQTKFAAILQGLSSAKDWADVGLPIWEGATWSPEETNTGLSRAVNSARLTVVVPQGQRVDQNSGVIAPRSMSSESPLGTNQPLIPEIMEIHRPNKVNFQ